MNNVVPELVLPDLVVVRQRAPVNDLVNEPLGLDELHANSFELCRLERALVYLQLEDAAELVLSSSSSLGQRLSYLLVLAHEDI